jgi:hypothetical protein
VKWSAGAGQGEWDVNELANIADAPVDGWTYGRRNSAWVRTLSAHGGTVLNGDLRMANNSNIVLDFVTPPNLNGPAVIAPHMVSPNYWVNSYPNMTTAGSYLTNGGAGRITVDNNGNMQFLVAPPGVADTQFNVWTSVMGLQPDGRLNVGWYSKTNDPLLVTTNNGFNACARYRVDAVSDWTCGALPNGSFSIYQSGTPTVPTSIDSSNVLNLSGSGIRYVTYGSHVFADSWDGTFIHFLVDNTDLGRFATLAFTDTRYLQMTGGTISGAVNFTGGVSISPQLNLPGPYGVSYEGQPPVGIWWDGSDFATDIAGDRNLHLVCSDVTEAQVGLPNVIIVNRLSVDPAMANMHAVINNGTNDVSWPIALSDRSLKSNIVDAADALKIVSNVPVHEADFTFPTGTPQHYQFTLIADEVRKELPYAAPPRTAHRDPKVKSYESVNTHHLTSVLWRAVQQLTERLDKIEGAK